MTVSVTNIDYIAGLQNLGQRVYQKKMQETDDLRRPLIDIRTA